MSMSKTGMLLGLQSQCMVYTCKCLLAALYKSGVLWISNLKNTFSDIIISSCPKNANKNIFH